ncbi:hypothetical protein Y032_1064g3524 [Ancylostoma ceylanicum]|uniref:BPTI/Kunitz inhibitor domain-containing protein n=1 Tax=Ancylostoma ceylanicum TaxID=53326 RepID=A0A016W716_9BILA|nr:hypothetical protein Y032_1064g3524 [Ancylostoma ceylanicum]
MRLTVVILCSLICFCTSTPSKRNRSMCKGIPAITLPLCYPEDTRYMYNEKNGNCEPFKCCECKGRNIFETEDLCRMTCMRSSHMWSKA